MTSVPHPAGLASVPYAYSSVVGPGAGLVFCAGACPLAESGDVDGDTFAEQAVVALNTLDRVLRNAGAALRDVVQLRILVASPERRDLVAAWDALVDVMGAMPPSTLMGVTVLGYPGQLVELEAVAALAPWRGAGVGSSGGS